ncbi:SOS response associated peptidase (SRAP) [Enterobacter sp. AG326]|nr:SOS response associated peptidase (SRAP) [Enterobacter sp. AG326]
MSSSANSGAIRLTRRSRFRRRAAAFLSSLQRLICLSSRKSTHTVYPAPATHSDITDSGAGFPASTLWFNGTGTGTLTQYNSREEYLPFLGEEAERDIPYDPEPVGRYNVAPGTRVLLLSERHSQLQLDPVHWGYAPEWWNKPALINARSETAADSRMFRPLWEHGRAIVFADGWFEWVRREVA